MSRLARRFSHPVAGTTTKPRLGGLCHPFPRPFSRRLAEGSAAEGFGQRTP